MDTTRAEVRRLLRKGMWCPNQIFKEIYPTYMGHYNTLRTIIAEEKHRGVN